jgi:ABC-type Zn uptake system ZnuABC Zn-binding protein ZnuA
MHSHSCVFGLCLAVAFAASVTEHVRAGDGQPLKVVVTVPDLGDLVKQVGGDQVFVTALLKGTEDPHFAEAKPSFIKELSKADMFVQVGMELEIGYAPVLVQGANNARLLPSAPGALEAAEAITPLEVPTGTVDRSMGDVHPFGNPHYLVDPLNGLKVARRIAERLGAIRPAKKAYFDENLAAFQKRIGVLLVGDQLAAKYDFEKLALLHERGALGAFLKEQGEEKLLSGWLGQLLPHYGEKAVGDHNLWPYFARRFGIRLVGYLEPKPGVQPSTKYLAEMVNKMKADHVTLLLRSPYFDEKHSRFVADKSGARVVVLAHQVGSVDGASDYLAMVQYNVSKLVAALENKP